jgi:hypothetical protein
MTHLFTLNPTPASLGPCVSEVEVLFGDMDLAYEKSAARFGFQCSGCTDNCCKSLFFHHTLAEWLYLQWGITRFESGKIQDLRARAADVKDRMDRQSTADSPPGIMCPANVEGLCEIYPFRPMICRLHGIPNVLRLPNGNRIEGPGCDAFLNRGNPQKAEALDRTPFYRRLAAIEKKLRQSIGYQMKIKKTVAELILEPPMP